MRSFVRYILGVLVTVLVLCAGITALWGWAWGLGLLATVFTYYAGADVLGPSFDLAFQPLLTHAAQLPTTPVRLAFVLAVLGFGNRPAPGES